MPYIYQKIDALVTNPPTANVGSGECVALVQAFAKTPVTALWHEGRLVRNNPAIKRGTAIATFSGGQYASRHTGNHAALYDGADVSGIWVVDQYRDSHGIHRRHLRFKGKNASGAYVDPSNNGDAFSVIE